MIKNIFLDRDGIVNEVVIRDKKIESPRSLNEFKINKDFIEIYNVLRKKDYNFFIASNQPDVARNKISLGLLKEIDTILLSKFTLTEILYCIHSDIDNCNCRKPKPGMIKSTLLKYNLLASESIFVGDSWKDIECGKKAGVQTVFLKREYNKDQNCSPDFVINNLFELLQLQLWN